MIRNSLLDRWLDLYSSHHSVSCHQRRSTMLSNILKICTLIIALVPRLTADYGSHAPLSHGKLLGGKSEGQYTRNQRNVRFLQMGSAPQEINVASPPLIFTNERLNNNQNFPNNPHRAKPDNEVTPYRNDEAQFINQWFATQQLPGNSATQLTHSANIPPNLNQMDTNHFEQVLRDISSTRNNLDDATRKLDLASINDRKIDYQRKVPSEQRVFTNSGPLRQSINFGANQNLVRPMKAMDLDRHQDAFHNNHHPRVLPLNQNNINQMGQWGDRDQLRKAKENRADVKADDRVDHRVSHLGGSKRLLAHEGLGLPPGCISRAAPYTSRCEDHLIKRLNQDATEGRTVVDVSRRVCCALFWHKDCIRGVVVERCPDSSPPAADILLGSRNLDLTLSCQRFNREGCNGATSIANYPPLVMTVVSYSILVYKCISSIVRTIQLHDRILG